MNSDFVAAIRRASGRLRTGDASGTTAIIQAALTAGGLSSTDNEPNGAGGTSGMKLQPEPPASEGTLGLDDPLAAGSVQRRRRPLGEVLRTLGEGRKGFLRDGKLQIFGLAAPTADLPLPEGAAFRDLQFACAAGTRRYRLYVPASAGDGLTGLLVMLHGCTQTPEDFAAGTGMNVLAEAHRLLVVYPAQSHSDNSMACWNWFRPNDQQRGVGEPGIISGLTSSVRDAFSIRGDRVFVAGLSAGGAMAAIMGETYPELYAGIGIHSGLAYGSANDVASAFGAMRGQPMIDLPSRPLGNARPRVIVFHGSADTTVHPANAERIIARLDRPDAAPGPSVRSTEPPTPRRRGYDKLVIKHPDGTRALECWIVDGGQHAWSGGSSAGTYTDPQGPDASSAMVDFFLHG